MESIHDEAARYGIERPVVERYEYVDYNDVTVSALTPESNIVWSNYLRAITLAKIALNK
jgi:hypothetical protein